MYINLDFIKMAIRNITIVSIVTGFIFWSKSAIKDVKNNGWREFDLKDSTQIYFILFGILLGLGISLIIIWAFIG